MTRSSQQIIPLNAWRQIRGFFSNLIRKSRKRLFERQILFDPGPSLDHDCTPKLPRIIGKSATGVLGTGKLWTSNRGKRVLFFTKPISENTHTNTTYSKN